MASDARGEPFVREVCSRTHSGGYLIRCAGNTFTSVQSLNWVVILPQRYNIYDQNCAHFVTSTVVHWIPVFCREDYFAVLVDSLKHCIDHRGLRVYAYVLMPNHFHLICSQADGDLSGVMRDFKRFTSRQISGMLERDGRLVWLRAMQRAANGVALARVWDEAFHPVEIRSEKFFRQRLDYLHANPMRAGYVSNPSDWRYSSAAAYFEDGDSPVPLFPAEW